MDDVAFVCHLDGGARSRWKALKQQYRSGLEEMENLLWTQLQKIQQINTKREKVKQLLQRLQQQSKHKEELQEALLKAHNALQQRDQQLEQLRAEFKAVASHMIDWEQIRDDLQMEVSLVQNMMNMKLLSLSASELCLELCLELSPGPGLGSGLGSGPGSPSDLDPLRLTVKWGPDESFSLQVSAEACGLVEGCASGRKSDLSATLLDVLQSYMGQAELLTEIQTLRSRFAIDWKPAQRCLVFLKSAALVCELFVEEGYPRTGSARLLTVRRDGLSLDTSDLQWKRTDLSLSRWLLLLSSSPLL